MTVQQVEKAIPIYRDYQASKASIMESLHAMRQYVTHTRSSSLKRDDFMSDEKFLKAKSLEPEKRAAEHAQNIKNAEKSLLDLEEKVTSDLAKI